MKPEVFSMNGENRRLAIIEVFRESSEPVSGTSLAERFTVSRQVIVQDIALLRAANFRILSMNKGYVLQESVTKKRIFKVRHDDEAIADELYTIVDAGGRVIDVFVKHELYGMLRAVLMTANRSDVDDFIIQFKRDKASPLKHLTDDYHYHTVEADSEEILDRIEKELQIKGYIVK